MSLELSQGWQLWIQGCGNSQNSEEGKGGRDKDLEVLIKEKEEKKGREVKENCGT